MASVYIETTIPSFYYTSRKSAQALAWHRQTRLWWDTHRGAFDLVTTEVVLLELRKAPMPMAADRVALLDEVRLVDAGEAVDRVAQYYISHQLMPSSSPFDAVHVAAASLHGIDFVLTWNCRHIANARKAAHLKVLNDRVGIRTPTLLTPYNLLPE